MFPFSLSGRTELSWQIDNVQNVKDCMVGVSPRVLQNDFNVRSDDHVKEMECHCHVYLQRVRT